MRDGLLGAEAEDIDIAVHAEASTVGRLIANAFSGSLAHVDEGLRVARVSVDGGGWSGYIDISSIQEDIGRDLQRRDFTINAIALPLDATPAVGTEQQFLDPLRGLDDLRCGVIRMVSPDALEEDPLRMLRGARLATKFGFSTEPETAGKIRSRARLISGVSPERVRDELMRMLQLPNASEGLRLMDNLELLCAVLPELEPAKGVEQPKEHFWDVFNHLVETVNWVDGAFDENRRNTLPFSDLPRFQGMGDYFSGHVSDGFDRLAFLRLAALLHDVAKPETKTIEASGRIRFLGHHTEGAEMARNILRRLRFGNRGVEHVAGMVRHHLRPRQMAEKGEMPSKRALYRYYRYVGEVALDTLYLNSADYLAARGPLLERDDWLNHCELIQHNLDGKFVSQRHGSSDLRKTLTKLVSGYDIIDRFALAPGPEIGRLLEKVREAQATGEINTTEQALELVRASLERGGNGA